MPHGEGRQFQNVVQTKLGSQGVSTSMFVERKFVHLALFLVPACILLGGLFYIPATVVREVVDENGVQIMNEFNEPLLEVDSWATWKLNWFPNIMMIVAGGLFIFVVASVLLSWVAGWRQRKNQEAQQ